MKIKDLQIGQNITADYWFLYCGYDDCCMITGTVVRRLTNRAEIEVISSSPAWYDGQKVWIDNKSVIIN